GFPPLEGEGRFSGSGCRAATTPPGAAAERLARTSRFAGSLCAAGRGATRRSATSSTTLNRYEEGNRRERAPRVSDLSRICRTGQVSVLISVSSLVIRHSSFYLFKA